MDIYSYQSRTTDFVQARAFTDIAGLLQELIIIAFDSCEASAFESSLTIIFQVTSSRVWVPQECPSTWAANHTFVYYAATS